jgi:hypothetical protein
VLNWCERETRCRLEQAGQRASLDYYRETGHLILSGRLGTADVHVVITPYAQERMRRRDIDKSEVRDIVALPRSSHGRGKTDGRYEVAGCTDRGRLRVVYERPTPEVVLVVTAYTESD